MKNKTNITSEFCFILDGKGKGQQINWKKLSKKEKSIWIHIDEEDANAVNWLRQSSCLEESVINNLLDEDTQPRYFSSAKGLFVVLRGVNNNRNADLDDMIALRVWIEKKRIISISHRKLPTIEEIAQNLIDGVGPVSTTNVFFRIAEHMHEYISDVVYDIWDKLNDLEDSMIDINRDKSSQIQSKISALRHQILGIRRYLGPQRDLFVALKPSNFQSITKAEIFWLEEISHDLIKSVGDLDFARENATVNQEELNSRLNVELNQTMYTLTIIMVVLSPLTLVTGILGANSVEIGEQPFRFFLITIMLAVFGFLQIAFFKFKKWF